MAIVDIFVRVIEDHNNISLCKCAIVNAPDDCINGDRWNYFDYRDMVEYPRYIQVKKNSDKLIGMGYSNQVLIYYTRHEYVSLVKGVKAFIKNYLEEGNDIFNGMTITVYVKSIEEIPELQEKKYIFTEQEPTVFVHSAYIYNNDYRLQKYKFQLIYVNLATGSIENRMIVLHPSEIPTNMELDSTYQMSIDYDDCYTKEIEEFIYKVLPKETYGYGDLFKLEKVD